MTRSLFFIVLLALLTLVNGQTAAADKPSYTKHVLKLKSGVREFYVYKPSTLKKGKKVPAVIAFHGFKSDANGLRWLIRPDKVAEKYGFIIIFPNAINKTWQVGRGKEGKNTGGDISFASALVDVVKARFPVDPNRIYTMGFSDGAQMVAMMACKMPAKLSAAAMVAHTMNIEGCNPSHRLPMVMINGVKDKFAPFNGGGPRKISSYRASIEFFRDVHGFKDKGKIILDKKTVKCRGWKKGNDVVRVAGCATLDAGHSWPGGVEFNVETFGKVNKELDANKFIFDFFTQFNATADKRDQGSTLKSPLPALKKQVSSQQSAKESVAKNAEKKASATNNQRSEKTDSSDVKRLPADRQPALKWIESDVKKTDGKSDGKPWKFALYKPEVIPVGAELRLIAVLGPKAVSAQQMASLLDLEQWATSYKAAFLLFPFDPWKKPDGLAHRVDEAMNKAAAMLGQPGVTRHIFAWSDGGRIAEAAICKYAHHYTSAVFIGYGWRSENCRPTIAIPAMYVHSKGDKRHPYKGNKEKGVQAFPKMFAAYLNRVNVALRSYEIVKGKTFRCESLRGEFGSMEIVRCVTEWGGNTIPGTSMKVHESFGKTMPDLKVLPIVREFIERQSHHEFSIAHQR